MDSELKTEISSKLEGDTRTFLLAFLKVRFWKLKMMAGFLYEKLIIDLFPFLKNNELDNDISDETRAYATAKELKQNESLASEPFLEMIKTESRRQMRQIFLAYETVRG